MLNYHGSTYNLEFSQDRPFIAVYSGQGQQITNLFVPSSIHKREGKDDTTKISQWKKTYFDDQTIFTLETGSSVWNKKEYRLRCTPNKILFEIEVFGDGYLDEVDYFGGYSSAQLRWGSGFFWSGQNFNLGMNPEPSVEEKIYFHPGTNENIDLMGVPLPGRGDWFFTPPPFCFPMRHENGWVGFGLEVKPGDNRFTRYNYHGKRGAFYLSLDYEGHTSVQGNFSLPAVGIVFNDEPYEVLRTHVKELVRRKLVKKPQSENKPGWWHEPIFCGWGAQCYLATQNDKNASELCTQKNYEGFVKTLDDKLIFPGIIAVDDKWQSSYGENRVDSVKWPDLRGFIDHMHQKRRKVLLWLKAWDPEGLPEDECITNADGKIVALDPSHPRLKQRLQKQVQRMLGSGGYNADGFKIDFSARIPSGPGMQLYDEVWGLELLRIYLSIISDEAKRVKKDALIMSHTPHTYLADLIDMIRLNDINIGAPVNAAMTHRAKVAQIACPNAIIDTDNWPIKNKAVWKNYLSIQAELGVPSLYFVTHIDSTGEIIEDEDYELIRKVWKRHLNYVKAED